MFTFEQVKELVQLVADRGLAGLEIERSGFRLAISGFREGPAGAGVSGAPLPVPAAAPPSQTGQTVFVSPPIAAPAAPAAAVPGPAPSDSEDTHLLTSPIVGTFYSASSPDAAPFVAVGDRVRKGQVLCIVEAMKLMNEIESDVDGQVVTIFPKNAQPVEYGERLFAIRPA